jgi:hypothetical protein
MSNYKTHLMITSKVDGRLKGTACNIRNHTDQWLTHDINKVTCLKCAGKKNNGIINPLKFPFMNADGTAANLTYEEKAMLIYK